ncbi:MAG TPA: hypothetical protein VHU17_10320 [Acidimicrobiales bacterium]|nr:hypothetical protein [Acidimicrobiales bacterium]
MEVAPGVAVVVVPKDGTVVVVVPTPGTVDGSTEVVVVVGRGGTVVRRGAVGGGVVTGAGR